MTDLSEPHLPEPHLPEPHLPEPGLSLPRAPAQPRTVRSPRGTAITCRSWLTEAAYR